MRFTLAILIALSLTACASRDAREPPTGLVDFEPQLYVKELWRAQIGSSGSDYIGLGLALEGDIIYAADASGHIRAFSLSDGKRLWKTDIDAHISGATGVGNGLVVVGTRKGEIVALDRMSGKKNWSAKVSSEVLAPPAVGSGIVVAQTIDGKLYGLSVLDGRQLWIQERTEPTLNLRGTSTPIITSDVVLTGYASGKIVAVSLMDGRLLWELVVAQPRGRNEIERLVDVDASPLILGELLFAVSYQGKVVAVNLRDGTTAWSRDVSSYTGISVDRSNLYLTDESGQVLAFDQRTGASIWKQDHLLGRSLSAPTFIDGYVVVGDYEGYVHWLARDDGRIVARYRVARGPLRAAAIAVTDTLFVPSHNGALSALRIVKN